jgi:hypothetical protein
LGGKGGVLIRACSKAKIVVDSNFVDSQCLRFLHHHPWLLQVKLITTKVEANNTWLLVPPKENSWKGVGYDG